MYQVKRKDGTTYFTTINPSKTRIEAIRDWFNDKWWWLKTFNKPPTVTINQDLVAYEGGPHAVSCDGRIILNINGNITLKPSNVSLEVKGTITATKPKYSSILK